MWRVFWYWDWGYWIWWAYRIAKTQPCQNDASNAYSGKDGTLCSESVPKLVEQMVQMHPNRLLVLVCQVHNWSLTSIPFTCSSIQLWFIKFWIIQMLRHSRANWGKFDFCSEEDELPNVAFCVFLACGLLCGKNGPLQECPFKISPGTLAVTCFIVQGQRITSVPLHPIFDLITRST